MAFKPSERFIRALDDAEVRPESMNAEIVSNPSAPPAERLGALIELSAVERAKSRAMSQVTPDQSSIADQVVGSFLQSSTPAVQQTQVSIPMAMSPQGLPGYSHGGLHTEDENILIMLNRLGVDTSDMVDLNVEAPVGLPSVLSAPSSNVSSSGVMGSMTGVGDPRDVSDIFKIDPLEARRMADLRNTERINFLATGFGSDPTYTRKVTYQDPDALEYERILRKRELGIPLTTSEKYTVYIPDSRAVQVGREAGESLQDLPSEGLGAFIGAMSETPGVLADVARETPSALKAVAETYPDALAEIPDALGAVVPGMDNLSSAMDILSNSAMTTGKGLLSGSGDGDTQGRIGEGSDGREGDTPNDENQDDRKESNELFDRVTEGPEGLSNLQQAMILLSAAQGLSAPIGQGRTTISNLTQSLAKGAGSAAANQIARDRNEAYKEYRQAQVGSSLQSARARAYNDLKKSAIAQVKLEFPDLYTSGSHLSRSEDRRALATARYEELVREGMALLTGSRDDSRIVNSTVRVR